ATTEIYTLSLHDALPISLPFGKGILSPLRLPVSPSGPAIDRRRSVCSPLGQCRARRRTPARSGKRDSNPRPQPWQGCALPTELFPRAAKYIERLPPVQSDDADCYGRSPSAFTAYHADQASSPESAASPPFAVA